MRKDESQKIVLGHLKMRLGIIPTFVDIILLQSLFFLNKAFDFLKEILLDQT
jgi:hypothetical protein